MKTARDKLDIINAYEETGSYRAAAELCGTTHKGLPNDARVGDPILIDDGRVLVRIIEVVGERSLQIELDIQPVGTQQRYRLDLAR